MKRLLLLSTVFFGVTGALIVFLSPRYEQVEKVSRSQMAPLTLQSAPSEPTRPQARPTNVLFVRPDTSTAPSDLKHMARHTVISPAAAPASTDQTDPMEKSYGIVKELQKPVDQPTATQEVFVAVETIQAAAQSAHKEYTVQSGDSLPGLAFRFYGTTAAYSKIIDANPVLQKDPQAFHAGMSFVIPDTR